MSGWVMSYVGNVRVGIVRVGIFRVGLSGNRRNTVSIDRRIQIKWNENAILSQREDNVQNG